MNYLKFYISLLLFISCSGFSEAQNYCEARSDFAFEEWIESVTFGNIQNLNSGKFRTFNTVGYSDFTDQSYTAFNKGETYQIEFVSGKSSVEPATYWTAYIDLNQDGDFDDTDERIIRAPASNGTLTTSIMIPSTAMSGTTRLRIMLNKPSYVGPCQNPSRGEVEDYSIEIEGGIFNPLPDLTISDLKVQPNAPTNTIVNFTVDLGNSGTVAAAGNFDIGVYLSTDTQLSSDDLEVGEIPTGNFDPNILLQDVNGAFDLDGVADGDYFLIVKFDRDEVIAEADESNNIVSSPFQVGVVLVGDDVDLSLSISADNMTPAIYQTFRLSVELTNQGPNALLLGAVVIPRTSDFVVAGDGNIVVGTGRVSIGANRIVWTLDQGLANGVSTTFEIDIFTLSADTDICAQVASSNVGDPDSQLNNYVCGTQPLEDDEGTLRLGTGSGNMNTGVLTLDECRQDTVVDFSECYFVFAKLTGQEEFAAVTPPTATTTCPGGIVNVELLPGSGASQQFVGFGVLGGGIYNIRYRVTDQCGNVELCEYTITVIPRPASTSTELVPFPNDVVTVVVAAGATGATVNYSLPVEKTNCCTSDTLRYRTVAGPMTGSFFPLGSTQVVLQSNGDPCSFNVRTFFFEVLVIEAGSIDDCSIALQGNEILCSELDNGLTSLYVRAGDEVIQQDLEADGIIVNTQNLGRLAYDSTSIQNGEVIYKLADGTIAERKTIPQAIFDITPSLHTAARLSTGEYLFAGKKIIGNQPTEQAALILTKTDNNLGFIDSTILSRSNPTVFRNPTLDTTLVLVNRPDGKATAIYTSYFNGITTFSSLNYVTVENDLELTNRTGASYESLNSITETPCGDLKLNISYNAFFQKGSNRASIIRTISKDGLEVIDEYAFRSVSADRAPTFNTYNFVSNVAGNRFRTNAFNQVGQKFSPLLPEETDIELFNTNDTIRQTIDYVQHTYATRNGDQILFYNVENRAIIATKSDCSDTVTDGVDLALSLEVDNPNPSLFENVTYTLSVVNQGTEAASNVVIDFDHGAQLANKKLAFVSQTDPTYNSWLGEWPIGDLAPGEAKTMSLTLFVLNPAAPSTTLEASIQNLDQVDVNSSNDLASATITIDNASNRNGDVNEASKQKVLATTLQVFPNPVRDRLMVSIQTKEAIDETTIFIIDINGRILKSKTVGLNDGFTQRGLDVGELPAGMYFVKIDTGNRHQSISRFVKVE